ncbi:hypothetical protein CRYUN_Cryun23aG0049800 [Craigia yunnanensis]
MEVPAGLLAKLWSFASFLPFFFLLFILGLLNGNYKTSCNHWSCCGGNYCDWKFSSGGWALACTFSMDFLLCSKNKRLGLVLKIVVLISLVAPLVLWPVVAIVASLLGGIGYAFFAPLIVTFEAVGHNAVDKCYHCFARFAYIFLSCMNNTFIHNASVVYTNAGKGSCIVVEDFTDFCFHSYFFYMDVKLSKLPGCLLVGLIGMLVDVPLITAVTLWKSPYLLFKGWKGLLEDLIGREGPFSETVCVPFAGLAILLWPLAVVGAVVGAIIASFFLGFYGGVIVHQEESMHMGFSYIISVVSLFDEYVNDLLYLREGSCLPRPRYRGNMGHSPEMEKVDSNCYNELLNTGEGSSRKKLISENSRTLKWAIQQYRPMQVWDWLFKLCEVNGRILLRDGLISIKDIEECIVKGKCRKVSIKLPAWSILQCLLASANCNSSGLMTCDNVELTRSNVPRDKLVMGCKNEKPDDWNDSGYPSGDSVRRAQLQAIIRRLQGIVASMSRIPTFWRRFRNLLKLLFIEAIQTGSSANHIGGILKARDSGKRSSGRENRKDRYENDDIVGNIAYENEDVV